jgi:hypothetical protein
MKTAASYFRNIRSKYATEVVEYSLRGEYAVALYRGDDPHGMHHMFWSCSINYPQQFRHDVIVVNRQTGEIVEELSDTIYLSLRSAMEFVESLGPKEIVNRKPKTPEQVTPTITDVADYARVVYVGADVTVEIHHGDNITHVPYSRRKTWSHRKYINKALEQTRMGPGFDFRYGWEIVS